MKLRFGPFLGVITCTLIPCLSMSCGRTVINVLKEARSGSPEDVEAAISMLGRLLVYKERSKIEFDAGDRAALDFLRDAAVESSMRTHRALAVAALGELQSIEATDIFLKALDDELWLTRLNAVRALRLHARDDFAAPLRKRLEAETEVDVRIEIVKALATIGSDEAIEALRGVYRNRRQTRRDEDIHALRALRRLTSEVDPELGKRADPAGIPGTLKETSSSLESTSTDDDRS